MGSTTQTPSKQDIHAVVQAANPQLGEPGAPGWTSSHPASDYPDEIMGSTLELTHDDATLAAVPEATEGQPSLASDAVSELRSDSGVEEDGEGAGVAAEEAEAFIASKRIGDRIKHLRQRKQMGLVELGRYTGLSASFLSQLETGRVVPTLRNLARLAMVFSKDLSYFFEPERPELFRILRAEERTRQPQTGADEPGYFFESLGHVPMEHPVTPYFAEFLPGNGRRAPRAHQHAGAEFLYMLTGQLQIAHGGISTTVEEGDAVYFNAASTHSYERLGEETCTALILTMPEPLRGTHTGARIPLVPQAKPQAVPTARSQA